MANVTLRFSRDASGVPPTFSTLLETGSLVSVSISEPTSLVEVVVDDAITGAVTVATDTMNSLGFTLVETNPSDTITEAARAELFSVSAARESGGTDLSIGAVADGETIVRDGSSIVGQAVLTDSSDSDDTTSGSTPQAKVSVTIPDDDGTWDIVATALVSHSNTSGDPTAWLENDTDANTLGREMVSEMKRNSNVLPLYIRREFTNTSGAGAKTIELQYAVTGSGTMTISDAYIVARKLSS